MKSHKPKVSFIMPAYNVEKYICSAIESIQSQTEQDWELIIADDCSKDRSLEIAQEYAAHDPRIRIIKREKQSGGCYIPRKEAIMMASSDFVSPLDADDSIEKEYLERLITVQEAENADAVYPIMHHWNGTDYWLRSSFDNELIGKTLIGREAVKYTLDGWRIHCNGGVIRKEIYLSSFKEIEEKKERLSSFIDEYLTRLILFHSTRVAITDVKYLYRENPASITHTTDVRAFGQLGNNIRLLSFIKEHYPLDSEESLLIQRQNFHGIFDTWRLMRVATLTADDRKEIEDMLEKAKQGIERQLLKGMVSSRYYALLLFPDRMARHILYLMDWMKGRG